MAKSKVVRQAAKAAGQAGPGKRTIAKNRSARHEYFVEETFEGSLPAFLAAFSSRKRLSDREIDELKAIIDGMRR